MSDLNQYPLAKVEEQAPHAQSRNRWVMTLPHNLSKYIPVSSGALSYCSEKIGPLEAIGVTCLILVLQAIVWCVRNPGSFGRRLRSHIKEFRKTKEMLKNSDSGTDSIR